MRLSVVVAIVLALGQSTAGAQELSEDFLVNHLGPAAAQIEAEGLDGSLESTPRMIEILQAYGIPPAFETSVDEARMLVRDARERIERYREAGFSLPGENRFTPSTRMIRLVGYLTVGLGCTEAKQKADALDRLSNALWGASMLNGAGAGLALGTGVGAPFALGFGVAAAVTGMAGTAAGKLATAYRNAKCTTFEGGDRWTQSRRTILASVAPTRFRMHASRHGAFGWWQTA